MNMHASRGFEEQFFYSGGQKLKAKLYLTRTYPRAVAVINPATGVPQSYYAAFAHWLADTQGVACLTYDYRDFGSSARRHAKYSSADMVDWGIHDQQAARDHLRALFPDYPLWVIGHSLGALLLPFQQDLGQIDRVISVASGPVHLSDHPFAYRLIAASFWFLTAPLAVALLGYLPGKRMGFGADIPAPFYWQWRRWCIRRSFFASDMGHKLPFPDWQGIAAPVKLVAIKDDLS